MVQKVLVFGHSFVHRLESFTYENRSLGWYNLGFDGTEIQVEFMGIGGGTLRPGPKCIQREDYMQVFNSFNPQSVFLQIGGNDLSREDIPEKLVRDIVAFSNYVITVYNVHHVIIGQLLPRYSERSGSNYNDKVYKVNKQLKAALKNKNNITYWEHRGMWKDTANLMCPDLVHLNKSGMEIYAKSVRAAVGSDKRR